MRRLMLAFITAMIAVIVLAATLFYSWQFAAPFAEQWSGVTRFGRDVAGVVDLQGSMMVMVSAILAIPLSLALVVFAKRRLRRTGPRGR